MGLPVGLALDLVGGVLLAVVAVAIVAGLGAIVLGVRALPMAILVGNSVPVFDFLLKWTSMIAA